MYTAYVVVTLVTIGLNAFEAVAAFTRAKFMLANADRVGVPRSWLVPLGALKGAGAAGLLIGLLGVEPVGIAAATGLVLFYIGAVIAHIRGRALASIPFPAFFLAIAIASLALILNT
ncbi:MAG TPA: DoxX family protein [Phytomonospora sp.]